MSKIRVVIVDDHPVMRDGIAAMLQSKKDFTVVASYASGEALLAAVQGGGDGPRSPAACEADVIVMDIRMPGLDGLDTLAELRRLRPGARCVLLAGMPLKAEEEHARKIGAAAYLPKTTDQNTLADALRRIAADPAAPFVAEDFGEADAPALSHRERQVLDCLRRGFTREDTARALNVSTETVKSYIKTVMQKLDATNAVNAVARAYELGVLRV